ncbi:hypothetical protein HXY32_02125 [Candidatus Bathyarchaeota archaeon]|nr:hypothetical protein [Candidatus Bathyarchaeota archaeon]
MTCYFRHLEEIFSKAGIKVTKEKRQEINRVIRKIVDMEYEGCPDVWREVKKKIVKNEASFVSALKIAWKKENKLYFLALVLALDSVFCSFIGTPQHIKSHGAHLHASSITTTSPHSSHLYFAPFFVI